MVRPRPSSGIISAMVPGRPRHVELPSGGQGLTSFLNGKPVHVQTPPDPLIRWHEGAHALNSGDATRYGAHEFTRQIMEDLRLHAHCWPQHWRDNGTPAVMAKPAIEQTRRENIEIARRVMSEPDMELEQRGEAFGIYARNMVAQNAINGCYVGPAPWMTRAEQGLFHEFIDRVMDGRLKQAARLFERAFMPPPERVDGKPDQKGDPFDIEGGDEKNDDDDDVGFPDCHVDDSGPFSEPCGDPQDDWVRATSGTRFHRASLRKAVIPARMFLKKRAVEPGGATIIDASGSMCLDVDDVLAIIQASPHGTLAMYSGGSCDGTIYVVARDGYRRSEDAIRDYLENRQGGNTVDLEAIEWLLQQNGPRVMVTDREFCGSANTPVAIMKLEHAERNGDITVVTDGRALIPGRDDE